MTEDGMWIVRYSEIALKGGNRSSFEMALVRDLQRHLKSCGALKVKRTRGRIWIDDDPQQRDAVRQILRLVPGVHSFSLARKCDSDVETLKTVSLDCFRQAWDGKTPITFRVTTKRSDKRYPLKSQELNMALGGHLITNSPEKLLTVKLRKPDLALGVEIHAGFAAVHSVVEPGVGGLPVGTAGEVMCMLSGGIDSPVAAWQMIRRGCRVHHIFFENRTFLGRGAFDKVERLSERLAYLQGASTLTAVPFSDIQVAIRDNCTPKNRVVLYRRFMYRIAEVIMQKHNCLGLVTGENLGQVASQTLENLRAVDTTVDACVHRPLLCMDKNEIIRMAEEIDTFETSIEEAPDCCSVFMPKRVATRARIRDLEHDETKLDVAALEAKAIEMAQCIELS